MTFWDLLLALGVFEAIKKLILMPVENKIRRQREEITEKKELAKQIIEVCSEGRASSWRKLPGSMRHIIYLADLAVGINEQLASDLMRLLVTWQWRAIREEPVRKTELEMRRAQEEGAMLSQLSRSLVNGAHQLRKTGNVN